MLDRRTKLRKPVDIYFNKFIEGYPYLCRCLDLSAGGVLVETFAEPAAQVERFPIELRLPGDEESLWIWVRRSRVAGTRQALEFVAPSTGALSKLERHLAEAA